ncbi:MAG TPA: pentapeptide repeat-containing protein [Thermoanaerobaculia bacterium]|nr:pentapeptide repeat-containing protein [Thermoanaerobaculia bacterium]
MISILVYDEGPLPDPIARAAESQRVRPISFRDYQTIIDFRPYVAEQSSRLASDPVYAPRLYVPQRMCYRLGGVEEEAEDALGRVMEWLDSLDGRFVLLLGDFGTGKTFLLHELARRMGQTDNGSLPILLQMRDLEKGRSLDALLAQHFALGKVEDFSPRRFRYMLEQGHVTLLFDGFDELALRVTYPRALEHFDTLLEAASGAAKVVVTSRRQHFLSDQQILTALGGQVERLRGQRIGILQPFNREQVRSFLVKFCGGARDADERLRIMELVRDLLGLSQNPRMLGFITEIPTDRLLEAETKTGEMTAASLYRLLIDRWLAEEFHRLHPRGAPPGLSVDERWKAVTALALRLWRKTEPSVSLAELEQDVAGVLERLAGPVPLDLPTAAFQVASGTLLVRDGDGNFSFLHQSVLEWLVANRAAEEMAEGVSPPALSVREISPLLAEFLIVLAGRDVVLAWACNVLAATAKGTVKRNALSLLGRLGTDDRESLKVIHLAGQDLQGQDLTGRNLDEADLTGADLSGATLVGTRLRAARLSGAQLRGADLARADLTGANLSGADLSGSRLSGAILSGVDLRGAVIRRAKLIGATLDEGALDHCDTLGAAIVFEPPVQAFVAISLSSNAVAWSPDGELLASAEGSLVRIWEVSSGRELRRFQGHEGGVQSVAFSPDGRQVASGSEDQTVRIWDLETGRQRRSFRGHEDWIWTVAFSPDGLLVASGGSDRSIRVWSLASGYEVWHTREHENHVRCVAFSADGQLLASASSDGWIRVWESVGGRSVLGLQGHEGGVSCVTFSPDGRRLLSGSEDRSVRVWELDEGREVRRLRGHTGSIRGISISADGQVAVSGADDRTVRLWETMSGRELRCLHGHSSGVQSVTFSPDGRWIASGSDDTTVRLWDAASGRELRRLQGGESGAWSIAISSDGRFLASGSDDRTLRIWDLGSGCELRRLRAGDRSLQSVAFSPDGRWIASGSDDETVRIWDRESGREHQRFRGHRSRVRSVVISPDGRLVASGGDDGTLRIWDLTSGRELWHEKGEEAIACVAFSADGQLVANGSEDGLLHIWDWALGRRLQLLRGHQDGVLGLTFQPGRHCIASASADRTVRLWNLKDGGELWCAEGHNDWVRSIAFAPDGRLLASGSDDTTVRLWDPTDGSPLCCLRGHENWVWSVAFGPDGRRLASGSLDNTIRLWDTTNRRGLLTLGLLPEGWVAFAPDGRYKSGGNLEGGAWHVVNLCRFDLGQLDDEVPGLRLPRENSFFDLPSWIEEGTSSR